jgi:predicted O-linked N-acetylglucosamine transferase (SPINDLY family)
MLKKLFARTSSSKKQQQQTLTLENAFSVADTFQTAMQYHQTGDLTQAEALYQQILQHDTSHVDTLHFLGVLHYQTGRNESAAELMSQAICICPTASAMYCNLGLVLQALGKLDAAVENYQKALALQPDYVEALNNLGGAFKEQKKLEIAAEVLQRAISLNPSNPASYNSLGSVLKDQNKLDKAIENFQQAILLNPGYAEAYSNLGIAFQAQGKLELALESYKKALKTDPNHVNARSALGILLLSLGQYQEGWSYFEARYHPSQKYRQSTAPNFQFPQWQGESIVGKSLVIWLEQGFGDEIQFCRYVPILKEQGASYITWVCRKPLKELLKTLKGIDNVVSQEEIASIGWHDYWTFALSTPLHCKTTLETIPNAVPYLNANLELVNNFASQLNTITELKVGVCWRGNPNFPEDALRSPGISWFNSLFQLPGVKFFTLQPETRTEFLNSAKTSAVDIGHEINAASFEEAAALIMNLDLVITSCTSICHLAGALGKPVWVVLPFKADWRWLIDREDSPWYPNTRLFRQKEIGNWMEVFQRVESRLKGVLAKKSPVVWTVQQLHQIKDSKQQTVDMKQQAIDYYNQGKAFRKHGNLNAAIRCYQQAITFNPEYADAYYDLGNIFLGQEIFALAIQNYRQAVAIKTDFADAYFNLGVALKEHNELDAAIDSYRHALAITPNDAEIYSNLGEILSQQNKFDEAVVSYQQALIRNPNCAAIYANLGLVLQAQGNLQAAIESYQKALSLQPDFMQAYFNLGNIFYAQGKIDQAIANYRQVIAIQPDFFDAYNNLGNLFISQNNIDEAVECYRRLLVLKPDYAGGYNNLGGLLKAQGKLDEAAGCYQQLLTLAPNDATGYFNLGLVLQEQNKQQQACENYQKAISLKPNYAEAYYNMGNSYAAQNKAEEAIKNYHLAINCNPNYVEAYNNLGCLLIEQGRVDEAIVCHQRSLSLLPNDAKGFLNLAVAFQSQNKSADAIQNLQKALSIQPNYAEAEDLLFYTQLNCCDWSSYLDSRDKIRNHVKSGISGYQPFYFLSVSSSAIAQLQCAKIFSAKYSLQQSIWIEQRYQHDKIRIAYVSADFCEHPVSFLMAGLFEQHNRERFEIFAISLRPEQHTPTGQRIKAAFNHFLDVSNNSDDEVAALMRRLEIDIAVDLMGFTKNCRPKIFAYRTAAIQINYLGYPATMGAEYIDYIFADEFAIPIQLQKYYTEKVVYLPECFQVNDDKRIISTKRITRTEMGLPETGVVFCSFNNPYKITPAFFDIWMRLLKAVPDSVLWLFSNNPVVQKNLINEAIKREVSPERLIFANRMENTEHLARFQLADLFLDTLPVNAGATASDALWAGVPVITCSGEALPSRMAGSLLNGIGLSELITDNLEEYEALILKLATSPDVLAEIKSKLAKNRLTYPLFNTKRFCRHIESAYTTMWERHQRGESPMSFAVQPIE